MAVGLDFKFDRAWAEIDLDALAHNIREIRKITSKESEVMGVVKADAYGHGVAQVSQTLLENGATRLAVATLDEAVQLRQKGFKVPVLILSYTDPSRSEELILNDITQAVFDIETAKVLSQAAVKLQKNVKIHIKLDTGMTRVGFIPGEQAAEEIIAISKLPGIIVEGMFTHFASADETDKSYTHMQFGKFMDTYRQLEGKGLHIPLKHVCNSAGIMDFPEMHLDMVRAGIILYGLYPSQEVDKSRIALKPVMSFKAKVTLVKEVESDTCISYGRTFTTARKSRIATIPVGYADGYARLLSNKGRALVNGEEAPVVGRVCMDQCMLDITDFKNEVAVGDTAVLFGRQGGMEISMDEVAGKIGTITYEVACQIGKRIPRVYMRGGEVCGVLNYLI